MFDISRQGFITQADIERVVESGFFILVDANVDLPISDHKLVAKHLFQFMDVHKTGKVSLGALAKALKKDLPYMASLQERPTIDRIPRFVMPDCQRRGTLCAFGSKTWSSCLYLMMGMRTIISMTKPLKREIRKEDFLVEMKVCLPRVYNEDAAAFEPVDNSKSSGTDDNFSNIFLDYAPHVFQKIRESRGISEAEYLRSISPEQLIGNLLCGRLTSLSEQLSEGSGGRSGASFYYSHDGKLIIKQISSEEFLNFKRTLPEYYNYMMQNPDTIISQFYGKMNYSVYLTYRLL
jgi:hypothetical protein